MLLEALESSLSSHARRLEEREARELEQFLSSEQINAWSRMLSLRRWLGMGCGRIEDRLVTFPDSLVAQIAAVPFGPKLATTAIRSENTVRLDSETCSSILRLLFEELWCMPDAVHRVHLDVLVGFYVVNSGDTSALFVSYASISCFRLNFQKPNTSWTFTLLEP